MAIPVHTESPLREATRRRLPLLSLFLVGGSIPALWLPLGLAACVLVGLLVLWCWIVQALAFSVYLERSDSFTQLGIEVYEALQESPEGVTLRPQGIVENPGAPGVDWHPEND